MKLDEIQVNITNPKNSKENIQSNKETGSQQGPCPTDIETSSLNKNPESNSTQENGSKESVAENFVGLSDFFCDLTSFEDVFEMLNSEGPKNGITFKKGNTHYSKDSKQMIHKRVLCSKGIRNKQRIQNNNKEESNRNSVYY